MSQTHRLTCNHCKSQFEAVVPEASVMNGPKALVVFAVPVQVACPTLGCSGVFQPIIQNVQVAYQFIEVAPKGNGNRIIAPGPRPIPLGALRKV